MSIMSEKRNAFWRVLSVFTTLVLIAFIWEALSPIGFDVSYFVYGKESKKLLIKVDTSIPDLDFKDQFHLRAYLMNAWDSIKHPLPKEGIQVVSALSSRFNGGEVFQNTSKTLLPGLRFHSYVGSELMGEPRELGPRLVEKNFNLSKPIFIDEPNTSYEWSGFIKIEKNGEYVFSLNSDDGAFLFIENRLIVDNGGAHGSLEKSGKLYLEKGLHAFSLKYFNLIDIGNVNLRWAELNNTQVAPLVQIPETVFYSGDDSVGFEFRSKGNNLGFDNEMGVQSKELNPNDSQLLQAHFSDLKKLQNVKIVKRDLNGAYSIASKFDLIRPSYGSSLAFSIASSILIGVGIFCILYFIGMRLPLALRLFYINCSNCVSIGLLSRLNNLGSVPGFQYTSDEFNAWLGLNLITMGKPTSWVWANQSKSIHWISFLGQIISIGDYQFHPPPLHPLIVGAWLKLFGATSIYQLPVFLIRVPSLLIAVASIVSLLILLNRLYGREISILGGLFFSLLPVNVAIGSLAKPDSLVSLLAILTLLAITNEKSSRRKRVCFIFIFSFLALISKEVGIFIPMAVFLYSVQHKQYLELLSAGLGALLGVCGFLLYAYLLNWDEFLFTMGQIEGEGFKLDTFKRLMFEQDMYQTSGVLLLAWIGLVLFRKKTDNIFLVFAASYVFVFCLLSAGGFFYPWYQLALFPFLALGFANCVNECVFKAGSGNSKLFALIYFAFISIPFMTFELGHWVAQLPSSYSRVIAICLGAVLLLSTLYLNYLPKKLYPIYCFLVLSISYAPFVYLLLFHNYV